MKPNLDQGPDYERGFVDGMLYQTQTSVGKAVNAMAQPEQQPVATTYKEVTDAMNLLLNGDYKQVQMAQLMADAKLYTAPPKQEPRNFCPRCGKRTADLTVIHTCTPPEGGHQ